MSHPPTTGEIAFGGITFGVLTAGVLGAIVVKIQSARMQATINEGLATGDPVPVRLTAYWPFAASLSERKMEGGTTGAAAWNGHRVVDPSTGKRIQLHALEDYLAGDADHVSVSGDPERWPFGQRLVIDAWPTVVFRVTDTGGHFTGSGKVYRIAGREPLDICVREKATKVPETSTAHPVPGDTFEKKTQVSGLTSTYLVGVDLLALPPARCP